MNEPTPISMDAKPSTRFGRWKCFLILVSVFTFIGVTVRVVYPLCRSGESLRQAIDEADRLDPGWHMQELAAKRPQLPDDQNMACVITRAKKLIPPDWPCWSANSPALNLSEGELRQLRYPSANQPNRQLSPNLLRVLRQELRSAAVAIKEALSIVQFTHGRFPVAYARGSPSTADAETLADLLGALVCLKAQDGDADGALCACRAILLCQRAIGDDPRPTFMRARVAIRRVALARIERALGQGQPSDAALIDLQRLLEEELAENLLLVAARGLRAAHDEDFAERRKVSASMPLRDKAMMLLPKPQMLYVNQLNYVIPGTMELNQAALLRYHTRLVEISKRPVDQQFEALKKLDALAEELPAFARETVGFAARRFSGDYYWVWTEFIRDVAQMKCALALVGAERFQRAEGRLPTNLDDLVPDYLAAVPVDPFSGRPLHLRRLEDAIVIYSVGEDQTDDDGALMGTKKAADHMDYGYRLWEVDRRRQLREMRQDTAGQ
jgi:hypothetical protein